MDQRARAVHGPMLAHAQRPVVQVLYSHRDEHAETATIHQAPLN